MYMQVEQEQTDDTLENSLKFSWHGYGINNPQPFTPNQPFRYPGSEIHMTLRYLSEIAFASNKKRMQNLQRFINNKNTELDQRRMPNRMQIPMSGCEYDPLKWQKYMALRYILGGF